MHTLPFSAFPPYFNPLMFYRMRPTAKQLRAIKANGGVWIETDPRAPLHTDIHYTDDRFRGKERTIFGKAEDRLCYHYSDRLRDADYSKHEKAWGKACEKAQRDHEGKVILSANFYSAYLTAYWERPCEVKHILGSFSIATGDPYRCYGYIMAEKVETEALLSESPA